jgi:hypothetical protein
MQKLKLQFKSDGIPHQSPAATAVSLWLCQCENYFERAHLSLLVMFARSRANIRRTAMRKNFFDYIQTDKTIKRHVFYPFFFQREKVL